jgi:hypothetical protein
MTAGSGKAEGFADGEWANHRQAALDDATQYRGNLRNDERDI